MKTPHLLEFLPHSRLILSDIRMNLRREERTHEESLKFFQEMFSSQKERIGHANYPFFGNTIFILTPWPREWKGDDAVGFDWLVWLLGHESIHNACCACGHRNADLRLDILPPWILNLENFDGDRELLIIKDDAIHRASWDVPN